MEVAILSFLFVLGACFGSFLCCQARRLHSTKKIKNSRSICLHCKYKLKWYDNIPIISWLILKGKCRKCGQKIGAAELISELLTALAFLALGLSFVLTHNPFAPAVGTRLSDWLTLAFTLLLALPLIFLAIYDALYGELPVKILYLAILLAVPLLVIKTRSILTFHGFYATIITDPLFAVCILSGIYLLLYLISHGKWVGDGDWLLCLPLALALGSPWLALCVLFLSNFLATIISLPTLKGNKSHKVHFGPFLVSAYIIITTLSPWLVTIV